MRVWLCVCVARCVRPWAGSARSLGQHSHTHRSDRSQREVLAFSCLSLPCRPYTSVRGLFCFFERRHGRGHGRVHGRGHGCALSRSTGGVAVLLTKRAELVSCLPRWQKRQGPADGRLRPYCQSPRSRWRCPRSRGHRRRARCQSVRIRAETTRRAFARTGTTCRAAPL